MEGVKRGQELEAVTEGRYEGCEREPVQKWLLYKYEIRQFLIDVICTYSVTERLCTDTVQSSIVGGILPASNPTAVLVLSRSQGCQKPFDRSNF